MSVPTYDLCLRQGNDKSLEFHLISDDGTPFDLTGSTLIFTAQKSDGTEMEKTIVPTDVAGGVFVLSFTTAETREFTPGRFNQWEIERQIGGSEETLIAGYMNVREGMNTDV